jgi:excisionase family DNA binding protein
MANTAASPDTTTYLPGPHTAEIVDFVKALEARGMDAPESRAALVGADGTRVDLPEELHRALLQVAEALLAGMAVTIAPQSARLTTQEAADFLGISRPTLVRLLERGEIPMTKPGRHRFVQLSDLVAFQDAQRRRRRQILDQMQQDAEASGLYDTTDGLPPAMR